MNTIKKLALGYALRLAWGLAAPHLQKQLSKQLAALRERLTAESLHDDSDMGRNPDFAGGEITA